LAEGSRARFVTHAWLEDTGALKGAGGAVTQARLEDTGALGDPKRDVTDGSP